jgi:uncharacterized delta-60 repeat protein
MRGKRRRAAGLALAVLVAACALAALVASAGADEPGATESLGIHYERTGFSSLIARPDGGFLALGGEPLGDQRIEPFLADGAPDPAGPPSPDAPGEARFFPAGGGKTFVLGFQKALRLDPDGSLDTGFGQGGSVDSPYGARAIVELGSGRIAVVTTVVGGTHTVSAGASVELLNGDGSAAKGGFSTALSATHASLGGTVDVPQVSPTSDGGALVVGQDFLLEIEPDGSLNRGFGVVEGPYGLVGGAVLAGGSVEAVGTAPGERGGSEDLALYRYTPGGAPDPSFGTKGVRRFDVSGGGQDEATVASFAGDGSVVVGGRSEVQGPCPEKECEEAPILAAFDPAGELDKGFAVGGALRLSTLAGAPQGYRSRGVTAIARRPDGSIVVAGNAPPNETTGFLAAVSPAGALLAGFGEGGIALERDPLPASQEVAGLVPMPDGTLLAAGTTDVGIKDQPILVRYGADDSLDRSFGAGAGYTVLHQPLDQSSHGATGFAVDGEYALTGNYEFPVSHVLMAHTGDGSPVASFGAGGSVDLPNEVRPAAVAFAGDGDPVVLGVGLGGSTASEVMRLRPDGSLDKSFGHGGTFTLQLGRRAVRGKAIVAGRGERILAAGRFGDRFAIASLLPDGRPDPRFGSGGWSVVDAGAPTHFLVLNRVGSQIYLAGTVGEQYGPKHVLLMRFHGNGRVDRSFGHGGRLLAPLANAEHPTAVLPTPGGTLVVLGEGERPLLTFAAGGKVRSDPVAPGVRYPRDVRAAIAGDGLVVGWASYSSASKGEIFHLARRPLEN